MRLLRIYVVNLIETGLVTIGRLSYTVYDPGWTVVLYSSHMMTTFYSWFSRDVRKNLPGKNFLSFYLHQVKVTFKHISVGLSPAQ